MVHPRQYVIVSVVVAPNPVGGRSWGQPCGIERQRGASLGSAARSIIKRLASLGTFGGLGGEWIILRPLNHDRKAETERDASCGEFFRMRNAQLLPDRCCGRAAGAGASRQCRFRWYFGGKRRPPLCWGRCESHWRDGHCVLAPHAGKNILTRPRVLSNSRIGFSISSWTSNGCACDGRVHISITRLKP